MKPRVIDLSLFFNEFDLLELRLKTLYDVVDYFVVVESTQTFSGKEKSLLLGQSLQRFSQYFDKLRYYPLTKLDYCKLQQLEYKHYSTARNLRLRHKHRGSKPSQLHKSVQREIMQRDGAVLALLNFAQPEDLILLSDADEIASPGTVSTLVKQEIEVPHYLSMDWYIYYINNRVPAPWIGTVAFKFKHLAGHSLDQFRLGSCNISDAPGPLVERAGWHFSYLGGEELIARKLEALAFQGIKASLLIGIIKVWSSYLKISLKTNRDLLFQGRQFKRVLIDNSYPKPLLDDPDLIARYSAPQSANATVGGDHSTL